MIRRTSFRCTHFRLHRLRRLGQLSSAYLSHEVRLRPAGEPKTLCVLQLAMQLAWARGFLSVYALHQGHRDGHGGEVAAAAAAVDEMHFCHAALH